MPRRLKIARMALLLVIAIAVIAYFVDQSLSRTLTIELPPDYHGAWCIVFSPEVAQQGLVARLKTRYAAFVRVPSTGIGVCSNAFDPGRFHAVNVYQQDKVPIPYGIEPDSNRIGIDILYGRSISSREYCIYYFLGTHEDFILATGVDVVSINAASLADELSAINQQVEIIKRERRAGSN